MSAGGSRTPAVRRSSGAFGFLDPGHEGLRRALSQPRRVVGLMMIAAGVVWAIARGLQFYGLIPAGIAYDLDQPPLLLALVGIWLLYRSRRR
jgi:hypothetical protein